MLLISLFNLLITFFSLSFVYFIKTRLPQNFCTFNNIFTSKNERLVFSSSKRCGMAEISIANTMKNSLVSEKLTTPLKSTDNWKLKCFCEQNVKWNKNPDGTESLGLFFKIS